jgi:hypothetical protein
MPELTLCIPGPWQDREAFMRAVVTLAPAGRYMYLGGVLADVTAKQHVKVAHAPREPELAEQFAAAGRGTLSDSTLQAVAAHGSLVFVQFPAPITAALPLILKFSELLRTLGGVAVKVESSGVVHEIDAWVELIGGGAFDQYRSIVTLVGDERSYYSCGMQVFDLPDCAVPRSLSPEVAADVMNRFNLYRIVEAPEFADGHTFSVDEQSPRLRLRHVPDVRHDADDLFHNPHGLWLLSPMHHN